MDLERCNWRGAGVKARALQCNTVQLNFANPEFLRCSNHLYKVSVHSIIGAVHNRQGLSG